MANFMQAIEWMKEGKKVKRKNWKQEGVVLLFDTKDGIVYQKIDFNHQGPRAHYNFDDIEATDWEIYEEVEKSMTPGQRMFFDRGVNHGIEISKPDLKEEKKNLSKESAEGLPLDQKAKQMRFTNEFGYTVEDVKQSLKEFIEGLWQKTGGKAAINSVDLNNQIREEAKEIFGERLI